MFFASDNSSGVPQEILEALSQANHGYAMGYGNDPLTQQVTAHLKDVFEAPEAAVCFVPTGTAANALALACLTPPWGAVFCHRNAHIEEDECGAPEFYTGGAKLVLVDGADAKVTPDALDQAIRAHSGLGVHHMPPAAVSLSNVTELGGVYSPEEVRALTAVAAAADLPVHMDGARFANALIATGATPADLSWKAGIDILSFGGSKNGLMGAEAVILFNREKAAEFEFRRKRAGHLMSKHRFISAQMGGYLKDGLWLRLARQANEASARLVQGLSGIDGVTLAHPAPANIAFVTMPRSLVRKARAAGAAFAIWQADQSLDGPDDTPMLARLVCSWCTTDQDISDFLTLLRAG